MFELAVRAFNVAAGLIFCSWKSPHKPEGKLNRFFKYEGSVMSKAKLDKFGIIV